MNSNSNQAANGEGGDSANDDNEIEHDNNNKAKPLPDDNEIEHDNDNNNKAKPLPYKHKSGAQKRKLAKAKSAQPFHSPSSVDPKQRKLSFFKSPNSGSSVPLSLLSPSSPAPASPSSSAPASPSPSLPCLLSPSSSSILESERESEPESEMESDSHSVMSLTSFDFDLTEGSHFSASDQRANTPTRPLPLGVEVIVHEGEKEDTSKSSFQSHLISPLPLSANNPFSGFGDSRARFSDSDKRVLLDVHPVQPQSTPAKKINLPFNQLKAYYQSDEQRRWLSYSECDRKLFCWICVGFAVQRTSAFITGWGGESNWRSGHCYQAISAHELSVEHQHSVDSFHLFAKQSSVKHTLDTDSLSLRKRQVNQRREVVLRIIEIVLFQAKQSLPFRAKSNEAAYALNIPCNHGNFLEEVKSRASFDPLLKSHLDTVIRDSEKRHHAHPTSRGRGSLVTFLSKSTVNKILDITANLIIQYIRDQVIQNGGTYSISMDGSQDVSVQEVMTFVIRYVDEFGPVESLVDVSIMTSTSSKALLDYTVDVLENKLTLRIRNLKGYSFDGAGNMAGVNAGLQALLKELVPLSVFQHCYAHILSLSLEKTCSAVVLAASTFDLLRDSCTIIGESYKRSLLWKSVSSFLCNKTKLLVKLGKTRWWAKARACSRIFSDNDDSLLPVVIVAMEIISRDEGLTAKSRSKALGDLGKWCSFETIAVGVLFNKIFGHTGPVSDYLQTPQLDHVQAARLTSQLIPDVSAIDIDEVLLEASKLAEHCNQKLDELNLSEDFTTKFGEIESRVRLEAPRRRVSKVPRRLGERSEDEMRQLADANAPNWHLKVNTLIPIKDHCISNLRDRFDEDKLVIFKSCSFLSPERFDEIEKNGIPNGALDDLCKLAGTDSAVVASELLTFAKCYKKLQQSIQADFPSPENLQEFDVDFQDDSEDENDAEVETSSRGGACETGSDDAESGNSSGSALPPSCKGCLRCPYRILRKHRLYTAAFEQLCKTYKLALTLPCTQVSCERCFSKLKIIKSRLRNKISEEHLKNLMIISVERGILEKYIDKVDILNALAASSSEMTRLLLV